MIMVIIRMAFFLIFQKSDRIIFSPLAYCYVNAFSCLLIYKNKQVDTFMQYAKYKGYYYILGAKGIYKMGKLKLVQLDEDNLGKNEKSLINGMKEECKKNLLKYNELLQCMMLQYGDADSNQLS